MKLKKKAKRLLIFIIIIILLVFGIILYTNIKASTSKEAKVIDTIKDYNYTLKDNKNKTYQEMFTKLKEILSKSNVNEEDYVRQISKMFIYDFYSLKDKRAKTDVGGVDFVYKDILDNFVLNAEDTYYKYVESNIYNNRKQSLPSVDDKSIKIKNIEEAEYTYNKETDSNAYKVEVEWNYTSSEFDDYQKEATMIFIHNGKRLDLVELQ